MPWGWECRKRLVKQFPPKPTVSRRKALSYGPGPQEYETPAIFCGKGFSNIKRAPAYTFGYRTSTSVKPILTPKAPVLDISGGSRKGPYKIKHGVVSPLLELPIKTKTPGPGTYNPRSRAQYKHPPAYTMQPSAKPPSQPKDSWTPSPNMYWPPIPDKNPPAYTLGYTARVLSSQILPGPGDHNPNHDYVKRKKPAFSFGSPYKTLKTPKIPPPNAYCEKKFMYVKRSVPAPSFGIQHSPYLGKDAEYIKPSNLKIIVCGED